MAERAAHLVDHVLPAVPIRQWVLSLPFRLRYVLAFDHALCRKVLAVHVRALRAFYRRRARRDGLTDGETGAVTAIQRWGSALNLNVHFHTLVLDDVFTHDADGALRFVSAPPPTPQEIARLVATIARRVTTLARRHGVALAVDEQAAEDATHEDADALAALAAASVTGRSLLGATPGARVGRVGRTTATPLAKAASPWHPPSRRLGPGISRSCFRRSAGYRLCDTCTAQVGRPRDQCRAAASTCGPDRVYWLWGTMPPRGEGQPLHAIYQPCRAAAPSLRGHPADAALPGRRPPFICAVVRIEARMSEKDRYDFITELGNRDIDTARIAATAFPLESDVNEAKPEGHIAHTATPADTASLLDLVSMLAHSQSAAQK